MPEIEKPSFTEFYQEWYQKVVQYIYKKVGNLHNAEDIASDVFLYCLNHYDDYDPQKSAINTWLFLIVNSRVKNHYRDSKENVSLDAVADFLPDERLDMEECLYLEDLVKQVTCAIDKLDERKQQIVKLHFFENKSSDEIAEIMGLTAVNVRVLLSRSLAALKKDCAHLVEGDA